MRKQFRIWVDRCQQHYRVKIFNDILLRQFQDYCKDTGRKMRTICSDRKGGKEIDDYRACTSTAEDDQLRVIVFQVMMAVFGSLAYFIVQGRKHMTMYDTRRQRWGLNDAVLSMNAVYFMNFIVELLVLSMFTVLLSIIEFDSNTIMFSTARIQDDRANKISECAETWHQFMVIIQAARTKFTKVIKV